ncbi:MAG: hypothetical protein KDB21_10925, partial [Acidimicrobiales bacterium]|nr:hypothetical protein [Acidimicrobiales bacterium]
GSLAGGIVWAWAPGPSARCSRWRAWRRHRVVGQARPLVLGNRGGERLDRRRRGFVAEEAAQVPGGARTSAAGFVVEQAREVV